MRSSLPSDSAVVVVGKELKPPKPMSSSGVATSSIGSVTLVLARVVVGSVTVSEATEGVAGVMVTAEEEDERRQTTMKALSPRWEAGNHFSCMRWTKTAGEVSGSMRVLGLSAGEERRMWMAPASEG